MGEQQGQRLGRASPWTAAATKSKVVEPRASSATQRFPNGREQPFPRIVRAAGDLYDSAQFSGVQRHLCCATATFQRYRYCQLHGRIPWNLYRGNHCWRDHREWNRLLLSTFHLRRVLLSLCRHLRLPQCLQSVHWCVRVRRRSLWTVWQCSLG